MIDRIQKKLKKDGLIISSTPDITGNNADFAYTFGLNLIKKNNKPLPDFYFYGADVSILNNILSNLSLALMNDDIPVQNLILENINPEFPDFKVAMIKVSNPSKLINNVLKKTNFLYEKYFNKKGVENLYQLICTNERGLFPWDMFFIEDEFNYIDYHYDEGDYKTRELPHYKLKHYSFEDKNKILNRL